MKITRAALLAQIMLYFGREHLATIKAEMPKTTARARDELADAIGNNRPPLVILDRLKGLIRCFLWAQRQAQDFETLDNRNAHHDAIALERETAEHWRESQGMRQGQIVVKWGPKSYCYADPISATARASAGATRRDMRQDWNRATRSGDMRYHGAASRGVYSVDLGTVDTIGEKKKRARDNLNAQPVGGYRPRRRRGTRGKGRKVIISAK